MLTVHCSSQKLNTLLALRAPSTTLGRLRACQPRLSFRASPAMAQCYLPTRASCRALTGSLQRERSALAASRFRQNKCKSVTPSIRTTVQASSSNGTAGGRFWNVCTSHAAFNNSATIVSAPSITCLLPSAVSAVESRENYTVVQRNLALELVRVTEVHCQQRSSSK
jgi:hypothetical protein